MTQIWQLEANDIAQRVRSRELSATEVTEAALARLAEVNPAINAVVTEMPEAALASARDIDARIARGDAVGELAGVPVTIKVNVDQAGYANTNGLKLQKDNVADQDNPVVANLDQADAVCIGRTNTPAFSMRWFTRNTVHGHTRNPHNPDITPGGSSGGAAAAVASGIGAIGHGSDIAGSIRYPAYACGIHGLRPTLGRVASVNPCAPDRHVGAQITAVSGPLARSVADLRIALAAMAAPSVKDAWWTPVPLELGDFERTVAVCANPDNLETCPEVVAAIQTARARFEDAGWKTVDVACPPLREPAFLQIILWMSEARRAGAEVIEREDDPDASFVFGQFQKHYPTPDLNGFLDVLQARAGFVRQWMEFLEQYPVVMTPVSAELPFTDNIDVASEKDFAQVIESQMPQIGLPFIGIPGLAVTTDINDNVPVGVQLVAGRYREDILLTAGEVIEGKTPAVTPSFT